MLATKELNSKSWKNVVKKAYLKSIAFYLLTMLIVFILALFLQFLISGEFFMNYDNISDSSTMIQRNFMKLILNIIIVNNLCVSFRKYFLDGAKSDHFSFAAIKYAFVNGRYFKFMKTLFVKDIYLNLWGVLYVLPVLFFSLTRSIVLIFVIMIVCIIGFLIKSYEYSFVEYILAEDDKINTKDAIDLSIMFAKPHIKNIFLLDLSYYFKVLVLQVPFIIWLAIVMRNSASTSMIVVLVIVLMLIEVLIKPHYLGAKAQLYLAVKFETNRKSHQELKEVASEELEIS